MSLSLMKKRIKTFREEMIEDAKSFLEDEFEDDCSYLPTLYFCEYEDGECKDIKEANLRISHHTNNTTNGRTLEFVSSGNNPVKLGDTFHDTNEDLYYMVSEINNICGVEYRGKMIICNYLLRWQIGNGDIIKRWVNIATASKWNSGETTSKVITVSSNSYIILMSFCEQARELEEKRVFIDAFTPPEKVFKITCDSDVLHNLGNNGKLLSFIAVKTEFDKDKDNQELGICNYFVFEKEEEIEEKDMYRAEIVGKDNIKVSFARIYSVKFTNRNSEEVSCDDFKWNIISDFDISKVENKTEISLCVEETNAIGLSFTLQILDSLGNIKDEKKITVTDD